MNTTNRETKMKHDKYCSVCHDYIPAEELFECPICIRSYDSKCAQPNGFCFTCTELRIYKISGNPQALCFNKIVDALFLNPRFKKFRESVQSKLLVNPIGLKNIQEKAAQSIYRSPRELIADIEWIYHNTCILYSKDSPNANVAQELMDACERHLNAYMKRYAPDGGHLIDDVAITKVEKVNDADDNTATSIDSNKMTPTMESNACPKFSILMIISIAGIVAISCILVTSLGIPHCY